MPVFLLILLLCAADVAVTVSGSTLLLLLLLLFLKMQCRRGIPSTAAGAAINFTVHPRNGAGI